MILKKFLMLIVAMVSVLALVGCNTVEGMGKDIKKGGQAIEKAAK